MSIYNIQSAQLAQPNSLYGTSNSSNSGFGDIFSSELNNSASSAVLQQYMLSAAATDDASQKGMLLSTMLQASLGSGEVDYSSFVFALLMSVLGSKESSEGLLSLLNGNFGDNSGYNIGYNNEKGNQVLSLATSRLGDPYSRTYAGQGAYTDCSYLTQWCYKQVGIQLPRTAAEQARYCVDKGLTISKEQLQPGDLVFFSHSNNGRYRNITHVAVYAGDGMIVDASSSNGKVVKRSMISGQVLYARPKQV